jgi:hypothetical protein
VQIDVLGMGGIRSCRKIARSQGTRLLTLFSGFLPLYPTAHYTLHNISKVKWFGPADLVSRVRVGDKPWQQIGTGRREQLDRGKSH